MTGHRGSSFGLQGYDSTVGQRPNLYGFRPAVRSNLGINLLCKEGQRGLHLPFSWGAARH